MSKETKYHHTFRCEECGKKKIIISEEDFVIPYRWLRIDLEKGYSQAYLLHIGDKDNKIRCAGKAVKDGIYFCGRNCLKTYIDKITFETVLK